MNERPSITGVGKESQANIERSLRKEGTTYRTDNKFDPELGMYFVIYPQWGKQ